MTVVSNEYAIGFDTILNVVSQVNVESVSFSPPSSFNPVSPVNKIDSTGNIVYKIQ